jgi:hypothetical protein
MPESLDLEKIKINMLLDNKTRFANLLSMGEKEYIYCVFNICEDEVNIEINLICREI